jgi:hypothetical protein
MLYQADTNILLRIAEPAHPMHAETLNALAALRTTGASVSIIPQNVIEFWNVATRPEPFGRSTAPIDSYCGKERRVKMRVANDRAHNRNYN